MQLRSSGGNVVMASLQENTVPCVPEVSDDPGTCLRWSDHPLQVRQYSVLYTGSHSMAPWMA